MINDSSDEGNTPLRRNIHAVTAKLEGLLQVNAQADPQVHAYEVNALGRSPLHFAAR